MSREKKSSWNSEHRKIVFQKLQAKYFFRKKAERVRYQCTTRNVEEVILAEEI